MAVRVFCSACDEFIKDVEAGELQRLTGKEKCEDCGKKIKELYQSLDVHHKEYVAELEKKYAAAKRKYSNLDQVHNKFHADAQSLYTTTRAELDSHLNSILEGEKKDKKK